MKPLILFDIDETLINSTLLKEVQAKNLAKVSLANIVEVEKIIDTYRNSLKKNTDFQPDELLQFIAAQKNISLDLLKKTFWNPHNIQQCLFPEVKEILRSLSEKYTLGTFSEGFEKYQKYKIESNELLPFFDPKYTYILRRKMDTDTIKKLPENTVIIDDRSDVIEFLQQFPNIRTFHIVRNAEKRNSSQISSLRDLLILLQSPHSGKSEQ